MKLNKMLLSFANREEGHVKKKGVYWSSEIYAISKGYITPENYFEKKDIDLYGAENIILGCAIEEYFNKIFSHNKANCEYQSRKEIKISDDIVLVVKPDFNFKSCILEFKFPDKPMDNSIPDKWKFQLEAESRAFGKPTYLCIIRKHPLITFVKYKQSNYTWKKIIKILTDFDNKLK